MLKKLLSPFTTSSASGVAVRDITMMVGAVLAVLGALGLLSAEQVTALTEQAPVLLTSIGALLAATVSVYRVITKSHSNKAAEAAKQIDIHVPKEDPVIIETPTGQANIIVPGEKK